MLLVSALALANVASASEHTQHAPLGLPVDLTYPGEIQILANDWWVTGWDAANRTPVWVAYQLPAVPALLESGERPGRFFVDDRVPSPEHGDYTRSGFDRGHLVPNHAMAALRGREAQLATFATTNIAPQPPAHNRGPWRLLEAQVLAWSQERQGCG